MQSLKIKETAGLEDTRTREEKLDKGIPVRKKKAENILIADSNLSLGDKGHQWIRAKGQYFQ